MIICNWSGFEGIPLLSPIGGLIGWPTEMQWQSEHVIANIAEWMDELAPLNLLYDINGDVENLDICGTLYNVSTNLDSHEDVIVIAPEDWA